MIDVDPPKLVQVLRDGVWYEGTLRAWRQDGGVWLGFVCYVVGGGLQHLDWIQESDLREA